jgi:hypothetical protein
MWLVVTFEKTSYRPYVSLQTIFFFLLQNYLAIVAIRFKLG